MSSPARRALAPLGIAILVCALTALLYHLRRLSPPSADSVEIAGFVERGPWIWYLRWPLTHLLAQALHRWAGLSGADALALLSSVAGALFLLTVGAIARRSPLILITLLSGMPLILMGHIEVYAWPSLILLWLLLLGPLHLKGKMPLTPLVTLFGIGCLMHMLLAFYAPALVWLAVQGRRRALERGADPMRIRADLAGALARIIALMVILTVMPLLLISHGFDNDLERLVPLTPPEVPRSSNQVTLLSPGHLTAIGMFLAISCPAGLVLTLARVRRLWSSDAIQFSAIAALCGLVFLVLWHPDMGWRGDWDLFAHPGLAINVLAWRLWSGRGDPT
ncbi:hypothetical protein JXA47_02305 [Candidatus Sumerlaeota bacterium]|nr:hypothetical protein [Candidatus Sumerlaeota bacterium]